MEKTRVITVSTPILDCFKGLPDILNALQWEMVRADPATHFLWWRKGDDWLIKRRHDLYISLYRQGPRATKIVATIKDARIAWGSSENITADLDEVVAFLQKELSPVVAAG